MPNHDAWQPIHGDAHPRHRLTDREAERKCSQLNDRSTIISS